MNKTVTINISGIIFHIEEDAFETEITLIKKYGRKNNKTGVLTNLTDGGEGGSGYVPTKKEREKLSVRATGAGNGMFGKKHKQKSKIKMSQTRKRKFKNGEILPTKHSKEWKQKLRDNNPSGKHVDDDLIKKLNAEGKSIAEINGISGITKRIIAKRIKKYYLSNNDGRRNYSTTHINLSKVNTLVKDRYTYKEISKMMNVSESTISRNYRNSKYY